MDENNIYGYCLDESLMFKIYTYFLLDKMSCSTHIWQTMSDLKIDAWYRNLSMFADLFKKRQFIKK